MANKKLRLRGKKMAPPAPEVAVPPRPLTKEEFISSPTVMVSREVSERVSRLIAESVERRNTQDRDPHEWYTPGWDTDADFVDIFCNGEAVVSGLLRREATRLIDMHNRTLRDLRVPPAVSSASRTGMAFNVDVNAENHFLDMMHLGQVAQRVLSNRTVNISIRGEGDAIAILEDAIRVVRDNGDRLHYSVSSSVR